MVGGLIILLVGIFMPREQPRLLGPANWFNELVKVLLTNHARLLRDVLNARLRRREVQALGPAMIQIGFYVIVLGAAIALGFQC